MQVAIASRRLPVLESAAPGIKAATGGTVLPVQVLYLYAHLFMHLLVIVNLVMVA